MQVEGIQERDPVSSSSAAGEDRYGCRGQGQLWEVWEGVKGSEGVVGKVV